MTLNGHFEINWPLAWYIAEGNLLLYYLLRAIYAGAVNAHTNTSPIQFKVFWSVWVELQGHAKSL